MKKLWDRDWKWTKTINNEDGGDPVFYSKTLINLFGFKVDLHKFTKEDKQGCFHTHPAYAIRIILEGGYVEEEYNERHYTFHAWYPGRIGIVKPSYTHRIESLRNGIYSYSLWLRARVTHKIMLKGKGWRQDQINQESEYKSKN